MKVVRGAKSPILEYLFFCISIAIILAGCGDGGGRSTSATVSGTVATGEAIADAIINIKDSTGATKAASAGADGKYSIDVTGMTPPFLLNATSGNIVLYSGIDAAGVANIHPFSDLIIRNWYLANSTDVDTVFNGTGPLTTPPGATELATMQDVLKLILNTQMALVMDSGSLSSFNMFSTAFDADGTGFDALLDKTQVSVSDTTVTVKLKDPVSGTIMGDILIMPAGTDISINTNPITSAMNGVASGLSGLQGTINANACSLAGTDIQPYFETGFMYKGWDIEQLAVMLTSLFCPEGTALEATITADYVSYDDATGTLRAIMTLKDSTGHQEQAIFNFKNISGTWVALGDGLPADIKVRSRVEDHIRDASSTNTPKGFIDKRQIEVIDYANAITDVNFTDPTNTTNTVSLVCDDFATPGNCDAQGYGQDFPAKVFAFEDTQLIKGAYQVGISTDGAISWSTYAKSIIGTPGADHTVVADFPMFIGISTHSISSVLDSTITVDVYTPSWVSEIAPPLVALWNVSTPLGEIDAEWVGIPSAGQDNQFTVTIPATYNGSTVTSAVLGQDAMSEVFEGWGQTIVWWYFE